MKFMSLCLATLFGCTAIAAMVDVGSIDQKEPPTQDELLAPSSDEEVPTVGLHEDVTGEIGNHGKANLYVLVNPLSNPETRDHWWLQRKVQRRGDKFRCPSQFGEG